MNQKIKLFVIVLMVFLFLVSSASADSWMANTSITAGLTDVGSGSVPTSTNLTISGNSYLLVGNDSGLITGYWWNNNQWNLNTTITVGIDDIGANATTTAFIWNNTQVLLIGSNDCSPWYALSWNGIQWVQNDSFIYGLQDLGSFCSAGVFSVNGTLMGLTRSGIGDWEGYSYGWNGTGDSWMANATVVSGLVGTSTYGKPTTFTNNSVLYTIVGNVTGRFVSFSWNGSGWDTAPNYVTGLGDIGTKAAPTVFTLNNKMYLISGNDTGDFVGYNATFYSGITVPGTPTNLAYTRGNFWVNHTWSAGSGTATNSYNVSHNGSWTNGSANTFFNATVGAHNWSNITIWAYNNEGATSLSATSVSQNIQIPNNLISISNISSSYTASIGSQLAIYPVATDIDGDTKTFATSATKGTFYAANGTLVWTPAAGENGTYNWLINVSDGYGSISTKNFSISVNSNTPGTPLDISSTRGNFWVNVSWNASANTDSYNISVNGTWTNGSADLNINVTNMSAHGWANATVYGYNLSSAILGNSTTLNTQIPDNPITIFGTGGISSTSFTTGTNVILSIENVTDYDSDTIDGVKVGVTFTLSGTETNYSMVKTANTSNYTFTYSTLTAGAYTINNIYAWNTTYGNVSKSISIGFTATNPTTVVSSGGGGGGGGVAYVVPTPKQTTLNISLLNASSFRPSTEVAELGKCLSTNFFLSNLCAQSSEILITEPTNYWVYASAFIIALMSVFSLSVIDGKPREYILDAILYGVITVIISQILVSIGFNVFFLNYMLNDPRPAFMAVSIGVWAFVITLIADEFYTSKNFYRNVQKISPISSISSNLSSINFGKMNWPRNPWASNRRRR